MTLWSSSPTACVQGSGTIAIMLLEDAAKWTAKEKPQCLHVLRAQHRALAQDKWCGHFGEKFKCVGVLVAIKATRDFELHGVGGDPPLGFLIMHPLQLCAGLAPQAAEHLPGNPPTPQSKHSNDALPMHSSCAIGWQMTTHGKGTGCIRSNTRGTSQGARA
eukprot:4000231-Amphidinium_carterae.1